MNDDFEDLLKRWLRDRGATDRSAIESLAGHVATLPPRRRRQPTGVAAAAAVIVALGLAAFALVPRSGSISAPTAPVPPDPAAFAGDPRLGRCGASVETALDAFEMVRARDYRLHLPAMGLSPELDVDAPGFVVVFRALHPFPVLGAPASPGQTRPPRSLAPDRHDVCVLVGGDPATAEVNVYDDVDIAGLTATVVAPGTPAPTGTVGAPEGTPSAVTTVGPAPAWVADLAGQLDCDGPVANLGGEVPQGASPEESRPTAADALRVFLGPGNPYASLPVTGYRQIHADAHWASFAHAFGAARIKAIIVLSDVTEFGSGWVVVGLRACDPSEFDPAAPLTFPVAIWTDAEGRRVSTERIRSFPGPGHCGWDSAIWLQVGGELYFRDPEGVMAAWTRTRFAANVALPADATDTGFRSRERSLWLVPAGDAYVVTPSRVERWPRSIDPLIGCA